MAFNFPDAPTADQEFTPSGGPTYIWKSPRWLVKPPGASAPAAHTHPESDITNLVTDLAAKASITYVDTQDAAVTATAAYATKASLVDADNLSGFDSAASNAKSKWQWSVLKSSMKTYMDTLYAAAAHVGAGGAAHANAVAAGAAGFMTGADKTKLDGLGGSSGSTALTTGTIGAVSSVTVTGIPAGTKVIQIGIHGMQLNNSSAWLQFQFGPSTGVEITGYGGGCANFTVGNPCVGSQNSYSTAFGFGPCTFGGANMDGRITMINTTGNTWLMEGSLHGSSFTMHSRFRKTFAGVIDRCTISASASTIQASPHVTLVCQP